MMQSASQLATDFSRLDRAESAERKRPEQGESGLSAGTAFFELFSGSLARSLAAQPVGSSAGSADAVKEAVVEPRSERRETPEVRVETPQKSESDSKSESVRTQETSRDSGENTRETVKQTRRETGSDAARESTDKSPKAETSEHAERKGDSAEKSETVERRPAVSREDSEQAERAARRAIAQAKGGVKLPAELKTKQADGEAGDKLKAVKDLIDSAKRTAERSQTKEAPAVERTVTEQAGKKAAVQTPASLEKADLPKQAARPAAESAPRPVGLEAPAKPQQSAGESNANTGSNTPRQDANATVQSQLNAQMATRATASQQGRSFAQALSDAGGSKGVTGVQNGGQQIAMSAAANQYSRAAAEVLNAAKTKAPVQTQPSQIINQVIKAARITVINGKEEMKLLLKPEELGWLKVRISVEGQRVTAHFTAENEFVRGLLENNINHLQQALNGQNLKVNQIVIDVNAQAQQDLANAKGQENNGRSGGQQNGHDSLDADMNDSLPDDTVLPELAALEMYAVDMRI